MTHAFHSSSLKQAALTVVKMFKSNFVIIMTMILQTGASTQHGHNSTTSIDKKIFL